MLTEERLIRMQNNSSTNKQRGLDALRGIGIIGIVLYHLFPSVFRGGFLGVPLFFVLSGYLMFITSECRWEQGDFHIGSYYKKRFRKIVPPLFTMVMIVCCYLTLTHSNLLIGIRQEILSIFLGYDNWWQIAQNTSYFSKLSQASPFTHLWFLAVEIQLYILWPVLFLLYQKGCHAIGGKKMCFVFFLLALVSAVRMGILYTPGEDPSRVYYGTDTMAFSLLLGIFLGAVCQQYKGFRLAMKKKWTFAVTVFLVFLLFLTVDGQLNFLYQGGMFIISLFFCLMLHILESQEQSVGTRLETSFLSFLGKKSYGIYLWHYPLIVLALM